MARSAVYIARHIFYSQAAFFPLSQLAQRLQFLGEMQEGRRAVPVKNLGILTTQGMKKKDPPACGGD
ncbi:MAG: hypothetical protein A2Z13_03460 [Deltaproteobacteria bacterium RBG_16_64_85]|nr:MAG: hypothetical protein A2Z13_03460 [Deltaproteobacteria bacterium RBG_16_64_85]